MDKKLIVGLLSVVLAACGSNSSSNSSSSSTSSSSSGNSSSGSSSSSSSSSSSGSSGSSGNANKGAVTFSTNCSACHKDTNGDGYFGVGGDSGDSGGIGTIDPDNLGKPPGYPSYTPSSINNLAAFIEESMGPLGNCDTQCSLDTAAYLWSLKDGTAGPGLTSASCSNPADIHYGKRALHFLTSYEYHNSLSQLFGVPLPEDYSSPAKVGLDIEVASLPNHSIDAISETLFNTYYDNAVEISNWAVETSGALTFGCEDPVQCANDFITEFAYVAYRRALTDAEQSEIVDIFKEASDVEAGLKWALKTALMSPHFLYRSELGTKVSDLLANPVVAPGTQYDFEGTPLKLTGLNGAIPDYSSVKIEENAYSWTGNDLIAITVKGTKRGDGEWPVLNIGVGYDSNSGDAIESLTINHTSNRTYYLMVDTVFDRPVYFHHDVNGSGGHSNGGNGTIELSNVTVGKLGKTEPVQDDVTKLNAADQNAYALDPYEYASALSFSLTGSGPSKGLLDAAVGGELVKEASREAHVDALIDSTLGRAQVERLAGKWFRTDNLLSKTRNDAEFTKDVRESMMQEIREIYKHVFYNGDFPSMYKGDFTFLNSTLSDFYGLSGGGSSQDNFSMVDTAGTERGGIIASGGYMAYNAHMDYTSPIQRAVHFRQDVLCQSIPLPVNLEDSEERAKAAEFVQSRVEAGDITTAEYYDLQTNITGSSCASCHNAIINPLFGMDDFDNVGRLRPRIGGNVVQDGLSFVNGVAVAEGDSNLPIAHVNEGSYLYAYDVVGSLSGARADAAKASGDGLFFTGAKDLGKTIVENELPGIGACLIEKSTRFALGYTLSKDFLQPSESGYYGISSAQEAELACVQNELEAAYRSSKSPRDVLKAAVMSDAFRFRK